MMLVSKGTHSHPLPPPSKPPQQIVKEVQDLISSIKDPQMTSGMIFDVRTVVNSNNILASFFVHPLFLRWIENKNASSLA